MVSHCTKSFTTAGIIMVQFLPPTKPRRAERPVGSTIGSFVPRLTQKAFQRFGFPAAAILTDWPTIVGTDMASYTAPERLKWPRQHQDDDEAEDTKPKSGRGAPKREQHEAATLVLRVDSQRALDVQYRRGPLIERINAYFGFRAVADLRIIQAPVAAHSGPKAKPKLFQPQPVTIEHIADARLSDALAKLGGNVKAKAG
jgi:hypothetical protein